MPHPSPLTLCSCPPPVHLLPLSPQPEEGRYAIEDLSARLPVDLSEAEQTLGMFTQNCVVVAEGELRPDGVFKVAALGMPPPERRAESLQALQGLDFFGGRVPEERQLLSWEARHAEDRIVLLSDVWLDRPEILERLHTVFAGGWVVCVWGGGGGGMA